MTIPDLSEYSDPKREALIRQNEGLQATLRARNSQISAQAAQILELRREVAQTEARVLESMPDSALLAARSAQLGLTEDNANSALEAGARVLALGVTFDDVRRWYEQEQSEESRVLRRIHERNRKEAS